MIHRATTMAAGSSLLLCAAMVMLWTHSYGGGTELVFGSEGTFWEVASRNGRLFIDNHPQVAVGEARRHRRMVHPGVVRVLEVAGA
jgi:hypothetical protein